MTKIGFNMASDEVEEEDVVKSNQLENYEHVIRFLGLPIIKITKYHNIDIKKVGKE